MSINTNNFEIDAKTATNPATTDPYTAPKGEKVQHDWLGKKILLCDKSLANKLQEFDAEQKALPPTLMGIIFEYASTSLFEQILKAAQQQKDSVGFYKDYD